MTRNPEQDGPADEQQRLTRLVCDRRHLELQAAEIKNELAHLKKALRITQERIRGLNGKIDRARRRPMLRLVVSRTGSS